MKKLNTTLIFLFLVGAVAFLAACGGSEPPPPEKPDPITITFVGTDDFAWDPVSASAQSGQEVTVILDNQGALEHNWILASSAVDPATASDADALFGANVGYAQGGETKELTFTAPGPGTYQFICTVAGHASGGMVGTFVVE